MSRPRWAIVRVIFWNASRPRSVNSNLTIGSLPNRIEGLLRIANVGSRQRRVVLHHPEAVGVGSVRAHLLVAHHQDAFGDLDHLGALALGTVEVLERRLPRIGRLAVVQRTLGDLIERIEPRPVSGAVVAITLRIAP